MNIKYFKLKEEDKENKINKNIDKKIRNNKKMLFKIILYRI